MRVVDVFHCGTMDKTEQSLVSEDSVVGEPPQKEASLVDTLKDDKHLSTNGASEQDDCVTVPESLKPLGMHLDGTQGDTDRALCNGMPEEKTGEEATESNGIDNTLEEVDTDQCSEAVLKQEPVNVVEGDVQVNSELNEENGNHLETNKESNSEEAVQDQEVKESTAEITNNENKDLVEEKETDKQETEVNGISPDEAVKEPDKAENADNVSDNADSEEVEKPGVSATVNDNSEGFRSKDAEDVISDSKDTQDATDLTTDTTDLSSDPLSVEKESCKDNSVNSETFSQEEAMEVDDNVTVKENFSTSPKETPESVIDKGVENNTIVNETENVSVDQNVTQVITDTTEVKAENTVEDNKVENMQQAEDNKEVRKEEEIIDKKSEVNSTVQSKALSKGQKLDQLLSKISTKAESESKQLSAAPKPAKARKSCASSTDNSVLNANKAAVAPSLTSLTFNVKELEKKGVLDIPKPKPSKRKAFEPIKIPSPEKDKCVSPKKTSPQKTTLKSPVMSPGKTENPFFNKQKIVNRRKKKGKRSGVYRLPGEKVIKKRTKTSEERQLREDSSVEREKDMNSSPPGRGASLPVTPKHSQFSIHGQKDTAATPYSATKAAGNSLSPGEKNALDILNMNSRKSFAAGMGSSGMKKAKKTVRHGIDPATHRTLDSFLKAGSHSKKIQDAQAEKNAGQDRVADSLNGDQRKRKAEDTVLSEPMLGSPKPQNGESGHSPEEKKRRTQQSPQQQHVIAFVPAASPPGMPAMSAVSHPIIPVTGSGQQSMPTAPVPIIPLTGSSPLSMPGMPQVIQSSGAGTPIFLSPGSTAAPTIITSPGGKQGHIILSPPGAAGSQTFIQNGTLNGLPMFQLVNNQGIPTSQTAQFVIAHTQTLTPGKSLLTNAPASSAFLQPKGVPVIFTPVPLSSVMTSSGGVQPAGLPARPNLVNSSLMAASRFPGNQPRAVTMTTASVVQQQHSVLKNTLSQTRMLMPNGQYIDFKFVTKEGAVPNGMYPVTPPRTPEEQRSESGSQDTSEEMEAALGSVSLDKDEIPLCTCKISGASFQKMSTLVTFCQGLDSVDGKVLGCCKKVTNPQLVRPAVKIPFLALCDAHRKRLRLHQCCPGCGHFCTQGKFLQCKKENSSFVHHFHESCQVIRDGKNYCPHCGETSYQYEVKLTMPETKSSVVKETKQNRTHVKARIGVTDRRSVSSGEETGDETNVTHVLEKSKKVLSTVDLPAGPDKYSLERVLSCLTQERPKKYRNLPKCLYTPAYDNDLEKVVYMLEDGYDPNEQYEDLEGQSALHAAASVGSLCIVHVLIQAGASPHHQDKSLMTPLMMAAEKNHADIVKYLIRANAIIDAKADDGMTALHYAAKAGHVNVINILLETDQVEIDVTDDGGWTPLIWAAEHMEVEAVRLLLKRKADPNLRDSEENTTMHWAAFSGSVAIAELLLAAGCDLDSLNMHGDRPLHIAARQDHYECVVLFLARGADVEAKNNKGETPLECCIDPNSAVYVALKVNKQLKSFGAKHMKKPDKLIHRDLSKGRENIPIPCVNGVDSEGEPKDYLYVTDNVETSRLNVNRVIGSLQSCQCKDDCSSIYCACGKNSLRCWYDKYNRLIPEFNMVEPPLIFECNRACECWTTCNNRVVQNGVMSRLQVFKTEGRGWGCKTLVDIPRGTFICEYIGEHISDSEADRREDDSYLFDLDNKDGETYCIDARRYGNVARFINHLCEPNLTPVKVFVDSQDLRFPRICLFANRDIMAQEELGFDYGEKFWIIKWKQFTCTCGSAKCRYSTETIQKTLHEYRQRHELDPEDLPE